jgi:transposase
MDAMTIAVDLAKSVFEVVDRRDDHTTARRRLTRRQFERFLRTHPPAHIVMEACGSAHHWARVARTAGHRVSLLPPQHVRPYVRRHRKTDRADAAGLLEAIRNPEIHPVAPKTLPQQELLSLHRMRQQWVKSRTARINAIRGLLHEFGLPMGRGPQTACRTAVQWAADASSPLPVGVRIVLEVTVAEIRALEERIRTVERYLRRLAANDVVVGRLQAIPGVGLLTATALVGRVGHIHAFRNGRRFASWLGLTPREHSSGGRRRLGAISKAGDPYLRMLLTHGARSMLRAAQYHARRADALPALQRWGCSVAQRCGYNKATIALANKMARVVWVVWARDTEFVPEPRVTSAA